MRNATLTAIAIAALLCVSFVLIPEQHAASQPGLTGNQTITFGALANKTFGDPDFNVSATASSGLTVSFSASGNCSIGGNPVHLTGVGSCTITASQSGDSNYTAATDVLRSFTIAKASTTTSVSSSVNPSALAQSVTFSATVTSVTGAPDGTILFRDNGTDMGPPVTLTDESTATFSTSALTAICVQQGPSCNLRSTATFSTSALTAGTHDITADYSGDANFNPSTGTLSGGQVVNNRALIRFSRPSYSVNENGHLLTATVNRNGDTSTLVTVDYASLTYDMSGTVLPCVTASGVASQRCDFTIALGTLRFASGETSKTFDVLISQDSYVEGSETFNLTLSNPTGNAAFAQPADANTTVTIVDDDLTPPTTNPIGYNEGPATANPIDDPENFVRQHYHDFLNREPDAAGLSFWTSQINNCGTNQSCVDVMRGNVSTAFFLSIENQQTGYFIERLYEACLTRRPNYEEYVHDVRMVGLGVVVGIDNWQQQLEQNKNDFATQFVRRSDFVARYPLDWTAEEFVDEMFEYAGVTPSSEERQAAISVYGRDASGRAAAMRSVMESAGIFREYYNREFVLSQYFGYLRRDPNDPPDSDWAGYDFWLKKMNHFSLPDEDVTTEADAFARVKRGEMVRAFIVSREYRERFGRP